MNTPRLTVGSALKSELLKLRAQRSTFWLLFSAFAWTVLIGPVQALGRVTAERDTTRLTTHADLLSLALTGLSLASIVAGIVGVLSVTTEFPTRAIRTTFTVVPRRGLVVLTKALALAILLFPVILCATAISVLVSYLLLRHADLTLGATTLRVVAGAALYATAWGVLGQALGWVLRSAVGATAALVTAMLVLPAFVGLLPRNLADTILPHIPSQAAAALVAPVSQHHTSPPAVAVCVLIVELVAALHLAHRWVAHHDA